MTTNDIAETEGISRLFFRYTTLNILGMTGLSCYILADTFFIANGVGSGGLTALNLVLPVYSFISGLGLMLGMGGATSFAILRGEGNEEQAQCFFAKALALGAAAGLLLTAAGIFFAPALAAFLGADAGILPMAASYLRTIMLFSCAFILNNIILCFVRNDGDPGLAMAAMLLGSLSNVILDYVFIFPMDMGMFGAALATGMAPVISMAILSLHWKPRKATGLKLKFSIPDPSSIRRITSLGLPSFVTEFSSGIIMLLFNFTILSLAGNSGVAAYGIIANLALIVTAVFTGAAQGAQPLLSRYFGSGHTDIVSRLFRMALATVLALGILFWLCGTLFPDQIVSAFNRDGDALLAETARSGMLLYFPAFLISGINIITSSYFAAISRPGPSFTLSLLRGCGAVIPAILILPKLFGMNGVWLAVPLAELITLAAVAAVMLTDRRRQRKFDSPASL